MLTWTLEGYENGWTIAMTAIKKFRHIWWIKKS